MFIGIVYNINSLRGGENEEFVKSVDFFMDIESDRLRRKPKRFEVRS